MLQATFLKRMRFLEAAENRETFLKRIALIYPRSDPRFKSIEHAYNLMKDAFRGVAREDGQRYFEHLRAVALILVEYLRVRDHRLIIAALCHDSVEDVEYWTINRVEQEFGEYVARLVDYLTRPNKAEYPDKAQRDHVYHSRFRAAPREFFLIKLADRLHNILTLDACPEEKRERKLEETRHYYLPYAEEQLILLHELEEAVELAANCTCTKEGQP